MKGLWITAALLLHGDHQAHYSKLCFWGLMRCVQLCMGPGEETLVTGGYDQAVRVWDMRSRNYDAIQTMQLFADSVTTVAVSARYPRFDPCPICDLHLVSSGSLPTLARMPWFTCKRHHKS